MCNQDPLDRPAKEGKHIVMCLNCRTMVYDFSNGKRPCDVFFILCVICQARMLVEMESQFEEDE